LKKLPKQAYQDKCNFIREHYPICQCCEIREAQDIHHAGYGAGGRDDRTIIAICRECHYEIHHGKGGYSVLSKDRQELLEIGLKNHKEWQDKC